MWVIVDARGKATGQRITDEEAAVMILSGEWMKGRTCDQESCPCQDNPVLFPSPTDETPF